MSKILTHHIAIRLFDLDINNHVNNSVYFTYMEEARTKLLLNQYLSLKEKGINFIVAEANCKYKRPIKLQDKVIVEMSFGSINNASFEIYYTFKNPEGELFAEGKTLMACFDEKKQRPARLPAMVVDSLIS